MEEEEEVEVVVVVVEIIPYLRVYKPQLDF
jgi:hypothetical protein